MTLLADIQTATAQYVAAVDAATAEVAADVAALTADTASADAVITGPSGGPDSLVDVGPRTLKTLARVLFEVENSRGWVMRGPWDSGTTYSALDVVGHDDVVWISLADTNLNHEPIELSAWWMKLFAFVPDVAILKLSDFGAVWDGVTDDSAAFQAALDSAKILGGSVVRMPPGAGYVASTLDVDGLTNCTIEGGGKFSTTIINGIAAGTAGLFEGSSGSALTFRDFGIEGQWDSVQGMNNVYPFLVSGVTGLEFLNLYIRKTTAMSISPRTCNRVKVHNCTIVESAIDGISLYSCAQIDVQHNLIYHCGDDGISFGTEVGVTGPELLVADIVSNNNLIDCQGIRASSVRRCVIANNILRDVHGHGIMVSLYPGASPQHSVVVQGNVVNNVINPFLVDGVSQDSSFYITVQAFAQTGSGSALPGLPASGTGVFVDLYDNLDNNSIAGTVPQSGDHWLVITGNICTRTTVPGTVYSDKGIGEMFRSGGYMDPTLTSQIATGGSGISFASSIRDVLVANNVINGMNSMIGFFGSSTDVLNNVLVRGNVFTDWGSVYSPFAAVTVIGGIVHANITFDGNLFDGDPYHAHSGRNADGSWDNGTAFPVFYSTTAKGLDIRNNTFRNVYQVRDLSNIPHELNNRIDCQPAAAGWNASNKGVGFIDEDCERAYHVIMDCTPSSATYGQVLNFPLRDAQSIPTTGIYVKGRFVRNMQPAIAGGKVLLGWVRLTTGSGHVLDTDWARAYAATS